MDDTNALSNLELTSTLDPLGFPLTWSTITSFFTRCGKKLHEDEIGIEEVVMCLEAELRKPDSEKKKLDADSERQCNACDVRCWATWGGSHFGDLNKLDFSHTSEDWRVVKKTSSWYPLRMWPSQCSHTKSDTTVWVDRSVRKLAGYRERGAWGDLETTNSRVWRNVTNSTDRAHLCRLASVGFQVCFPLLSIYLYALYLSSGSCWGEI